MYPSVVAHFQPIVSLKTGKAVGFEALARVTGEGNGRSEPGAQWSDDGTLVQTMVEQAAAALENWRDAPGGAAMFVQVNVTGKDVLRGDLANLISAVRSRHKLPAGAIILEMTEHLPITDMDQTVQALAAVKAAGVGLVLDDFGSGYSSLAWLHDLPLDGLKIDGGLTRKLGSERGNVILAATVQLGHALGLRVTAEGVEDRDHGRQLRAIGVDQVQGFAYGRPMAADDLLTCLQTGQLLSDCVLTDGVNE
ncbi:MAG: EAL domain-containing protein [Pseudomonadota bacterium]